MDRQSNAGAAKNVMAERFEVIVVGAGPAGAICARELALLGHRVLLLERETLPRYKPCGGGVSAKTATQLPFAIDDVPHVRLDRIAFRLRGVSPITWDLADEFPFYMVMRSDLDYRLVQAAVAAGARLRTSEAVRGLVRSAEEFVVDTDKGCYMAQYVVGADGATSVVRRSLGIQPRRESGIALECELSVPDDTYQAFAATALFDIEAVPDGYGWIFPKKTHLSVGVGGMGRRSLPFRNLLQDFILHYELASPDSLDSLPIHVHPLPLATLKERARDGNALLVGDAVGVADGFCGEGICYALKSGQLAACHISRALNGEKDALASYESELDRVVRRDQGHANLMGRIVRRFPDASYRILTSMGEGRSVLIPLMLGEISFGDALRRLPGLIGLDQSES